MSLLSKLKPLRLFAIAAAIIFSTRLKDAGQRQKFYLYTLLGYILYSLKAPAIPKGCSPKGAPKPLPYIGHLSLYPKFRADPHGCSLDICRKTNFQTFAISFPDNMSVLAVLDPEDRKHFFKTNFANYPKNYNYKFGFNKVFPELFGGGIFAVDGDKWKTHRKVASNLFTGKMISVTMGKVFIRHGEMLRDAMLDFAKRNEAFDIQLLLQSLVFDAFCEIAFGISVRSFDQAVKGEKQEFQQAFDFSQVASAQRMIDPPIYRELVKFFQLGSEKELSKSVAFMDEFIKKIVVERKKDLAENPEKYEDVQDILGLYLQHAVKKNKPELLDDVYLRDLILNFMVAGRDTTSYVMTNVLSLLSENSEIQEQLHQEAKTKMKDGIEHLAEKMKVFPLADAIFNESLRMYPSVGTDLRFCKNDDTLPSGVKVKAGTLCLIPIYAIGRDPHLCFEPDTFMPRRWINKEGQCDRIDEYKYPLFWAGYRICLGKDMARFESKVFMSIILNSVKLSMAKPRDDTFSPGPVMFYKNGMFLKAEAR